MTLSKQRTVIMLTLLALLLVGGVAVAQKGGVYDLTWWTVDGGGDTGSGGDYSLTGTAGQPEPGSASRGGDYTLFSGFWPGGGEAPSCTEVTGVNLALVTPGDLYTDTVVAFSADISPNSAEKPYTYIIDYDDGPPSTSTSSADPLTTPLNHTFDGIGTYDVEIKVWNCTMSEPQAKIDSVQVTVKTHAVLDKHTYLPLVTGKHQASPAGWENRR